MKIWEAKKKRAEEGTMPWYMAPKPDHRHTVVGASNSGKTFNALAEIFGSNLHLMIDHLHIIGTSTHQECYERLKEYAWGQKHVDLAKYVTENVKPPKTPHKAPAAFFQLNAPVAKGRLGGLKRKENKTMKKINFSFYPDGPPKKRIKLSDGRNKIRVRRQQEDMLKRVNAILPRSYLDHGQIAKIDQPQKKKKKDDEFSKITPPKGTMAISFYLKGQKMPDLDKLNHNVNHMILTDDLDEEQMKYIESIVPKARHFKVMMKICMQNYFRLSRHFIRTNSRFITLFKPVLKDLQAIYTDFISSYDKHISFEDFKKWAIDRTRVSEEYPFPSITLDFIGNLERKVMLGANYTPFGMLRGGLNDFFIFSKHRGIRMILQELPTDIPAFKDKVKRSFEYSSTFYSEEEQKLFEKEKKEQL